MMIVWWRRVGGVCGTALLMCACNGSGVGPGPGPGPGPSEAVLVGAGDIGLCGSNAPEATARLLDDIPGIGPSRRRALLKALGSVDGVVKASVEDIAKVDGVGRAMALRIKAALGDPAVDEPAPE